MTQVRRLIYQVNVQQRHQMSIQHVILLIPVVVIVNAIIVYQQDGNNSLAELALNWLLIQLVHTYVAQVLFHLLLVRLC
jgi:hypothetical protein